MEESWNSIIRSDVHEGNIFLHWEDEDILLPSVRLGDWEIGSYHPCLKGQLIRMEEYALIQRL
jgi:hypothetical protein